MSRTIRISIALALAAALCGPAAPLAHAANRNKTRTSVNTRKTTNVNVDRNRNVDIDRRRNVDVDIDRRRDVDIDVDRRRDVDIDIDRDIDIDIDRRGCCWGTAAAIATTAVVTAAVVGSTVNTLPPACTVTVVNGFAYQQCGSVWYQPQFVGTTTSYVVVNAPR